MKEIFNSAANVEVQAASSESTKTVMAEVNTEYLFKLIVHSCLSEKNGFERSSKESLSEKEFGLMEVIRWIGDNILFDVYKALDYDEENLDFNIQTTEGYVELKTDFGFNYEVSGCAGKKMFIAALDAYLHTQKTCTMLIDCILRKSLIIHFEACEHCGYTDEDEPIYEIGFSWEIKDNESEEKFVDSSNKRYVFD